VSVDGYEVNNLTDGDKGKIIFVFFFLILRSHCNQTNTPGFMTAGFIKPPVDIILSFP